MFPDRRVWSGTPGGFAFIPAGRGVGKPDWLGARKRYVCGCSFIQGKGHFGPPFFCLLPWTDVIITVIPSLSSLVSTLSFVTLTIWHFWWKLCSFSRSLVSWCFVSSRVIPRIRVAYDTIWSLLALASVSVATSFLRERTTP